MKNWFLTIIMADLELFFFKRNSIGYTKAFVKHYNKKNSKQAYKIFEIIELQKLHVFSSIIAITLVFI